MKRIAATIFAIALCAAVVAFAPAPAYAVDGTVLINQNTVINGLPGCPTGGHFPIVICQSGSYKLSGNLKVPAGMDAIDVSVAGVTLDLNGFTIAGTSKTGTGVSGSLSADEVTVENGRITGFDSAVWLAGQSASIDHITANNNGTYGIFIGDGQVLHSTANQNGFGIALEHGGTVSNCYVSRNANDGIIALLDGSAPITGVNITNNLINWNGGIGLALDTGSGLLDGSPGPMEGYGLNTITLNHVDVVGGASMGNNICTSGKC